MILYIMYISLYDHNIYNYNIHIYDCIIYIYIYTHIYICTNEITDKHYR